MAFKSVAPIYEVVITLSLPPFCVNSLNSSIIFTSPLHLINETSISILSHESISFFNSVNMLGSCPEPVNKDVIDIEVSGLIISVDSTIVLMLSLESSTARSCSALSSTDKSPISSSPVASAIIFTILFVRSILFFTESLLSCI